MRRKTLIIFIVILLFLTLFLIDFWIYEKDSRIIIILMLITFLICMTAGFVASKKEKKWISEYNSMEPIDCDEPKKEKNEVNRVISDDKKTIICIYKRNNIYKYIIYVKKLEEDSYNYCKYFYWVPLNKGGFSFFDTSDKALKEALRDII